MENWPQTTVVLTFVSVVVVSYVLGAAAVWLAVRLRPLNKPSLGNVPKVQKVILLVALVLFNAGYLLTLFSPHLFMGLVLSLVLATASVWCALDGALFMGELLDKPLRKRRR